MTMSHLRTALAVLVVVCAIATPALARPTDDIIHAFHPHDASPSSGLLADGRGDFYGELSTGENGAGDVYELVPQNRGWSYRTVHQFFGGTAGCTPGHGLIFDAAGNLDGVGVCGYREGYGVVFRLEPPSGSAHEWKESVLYRFPTGGRSGQAPFGRLVEDAAGNLYGVTAEGGASGQGLVYRLTPPPHGKGLWSQSVIYAFTGNADGALPDGGLLMDAAGTLYGTTEYGGYFSSYCQSGCGVVFALTPPSRRGDPWQETVLHAFTGFDGALPNGDLVADAAGDLYGTNEIGYGPGTVFELTPTPSGSWNEQVLHQFSFSDPVDYPQSGLIFDVVGNLYGTTSAGGAPPYLGGVYELSPPTSGPSWTLTLLHAFMGGKDGAYPSTPLAFGQDGRLYGTTQYGGAGACSSPIAGCGTAFRLFKPGSKPRVERHW